MPIELSCPECGRVLFAPDGRAGQTVACPGCKRRLQVPRAAEPSPAQSGSIKTSCPRCDAKIQVAAGLMGRQIACKTCQARLLVLLVVSEVEPSGLAPPQGMPQSRQAAPQAPAAVAVAQGPVTTQPGPDGRTASQAKPEVSPASAAPADVSTPRRIAPWVLPLVLAGGLGLIAIAGFAIVFGDLLGSGRSPIGGAILGAEHQSGKVVFTPLGPPARPTAETTFRNGQYQFNRANGPCAGLHRVSVRFDRQAGGSREQPVPVVVPEDSPWQVDIKL